MSPYLHPATGQMGTLLGVGGEGGGKGLKQRLRSESYSLDYESSTPSLILFII